MPGKMSRLALPGRGGPSSYIGPLPEEDIQVRLAARKIPSEAWFAAHPDGESTEPLTDADYVVRSVPGRRDQRDAVSRVEARRRRRSRPPEGQGTAGVAHGGRERRAGGPDSRRAEIARLRRANALRAPSAPEDTMRQIATATDGVGYVIRLCRLIEKVDGEEVGSDAAMLIEDGVDVGPRATFALAREMATSRTKARVGDAYPTTLAWRTEA